MSALTHPFWLLTNQRARHSNSILFNFPFIHKSGWNLVPDEQLNLMITFDYERSLQEQDSIDFRENGFSYHQETARPIDHYL